jgi:hypothetical protein
METSPAPAAGNPTSLKVAIKRPSTVAEVAFPLLVNDHQRPSPDENARLVDKSAAT